MDTRADIKGGHCLVCKNSYNKTEVQYGAPGPPIEGDVSVCLHCGTICLFDKDLNLRQAIANELNDMARTDPDGYRIVIEARRFIQERNKNN